MDDQSPMRPTISAQQSTDLHKIIEELDSSASRERDLMQRTPSESTFTRHSNKIHAIIKEILMVIMCILQTYMLMKLNK